MRSLVVVVLACLASPVTGHAILINPIPRTGTDGGGQGNKLQPFGDARNANCGGANNGDEPPFNAALRQPTVASTPGSSIGVQWELTIPHDADNMDIGVRVAVHYSCEDSFNDNILAGCLDGDPRCDDQTNAGVYLNRKAAAPAPTPRAPSQLAEGTEEEPRGRPGLMSTAVCVFTPRLSRGSLGIGACS